MGSLGTAVLDLTTDDSKLTTGLAAAHAKTNQSLKKWQRVGSSMSRSITLPVVAAGVAAVKLSMDFESSMGAMVALAGVSEKQVDKWGKSILDLAPKLGKAPKELADALYFVASSGVPAAKAMSVLTVSAKASAAGLGETVTVADAITSAMNSYAKSNLTAAQAGDILVATVREGKGEASAIAPVLGALLPLASELGVGFEEVGGSIAQMTRLGMPASEAGTALQAVMSGLLKPSVDGSKALKGVGLSAAGLRDQLAKKGVLSVLGTLNEKFDGNTDAIARVFPNIRALRGALALAGKAGGSSAKVFDGVANSTGALNHAFATVSEESGFKFKQNMAQLKVSGIELGNVLIPVFTRVMGAVAAVARAFGNMSPGMQKVVLVAIGLVAALGPLITVVTNVIIVVKALSVAMAFLAANPAVLLLVAFVALVAAVVLLYKHNATFRASVIAVGNALKTALYAVGTAAMAVKTFIIGAFQAVMNWLRSNWRTIVTIISGPFFPLVALATNAFGVRSALIAAFHAVVAAVRAAMSNVIGAIRGAVGAVTGAARSVGRGIWNGIKAGASALGSLYSFLWGKVSSAISSLVDSALGGAAAIGRAIVDGIISGVGGLYSALKNKLEEDLKGVLSSLNPFSPVEHGGEIYIGKPIVEGAIRGVEKNKRQFAKKLSKAVREAVTQAKQNLTQLGQSVTQTLSDAIDVTTSRQLAGVDDSAEGKRLAALQNQLDAESTAKQRADLEQAVKDAETDEDKKDAADALRTFELEQEKGALEKTLQARRDQIAREAEARKTALNQGITDLTDSLNRGLISHETFLMQLNALIAAQAPEYNNLGALLGNSAARGFADAWDALMSQSGMVQFGSQGGSGAGITVTSPEGVANREAAEKARKAAAAAKKAQKTKLEKQLATMRDVANNPTSPGGTTVTPAERQAIENLQHRIKGLARGGLVRGALGTDRAGLFRLGNGEGVFRASAMEGMQRFFEKGRQSGGVQVHFNGPIMGTGDERGLARELARIIQPELSRRVSLS